MNVIVFLTAIYIILVISNYLNIETFSILSVHYSTFFISTGNEVHHYFAEMNKRFHNSRIRG